MSIINELTINPDEGTLEAMLLAEIERVNREMDPFHAARHNERLDAAARFVRSFRDKCGRKDCVTRPFRVSELVNLDPVVVADVVAWDLGPEGKARVADMVQNLTDHARKYLAERQPEVQDIPPSLAKELAEFVNRNLAQHLSHPIRSRITLDLSIYPTLANPIR